MHPYKIKVIKHYLLQSEAHLQSLLTKKCLPIIHYDLKRNIDYFFYWEKYLYGFYRLVRTGYRHHYLTKNHFKPLYYLIKNKTPEEIGAELEDSYKISNFFRQSNLQSKKLYLSLTSLGNKVRVQWCLEHANALFDEITFEMDDELETMLDELDACYQKEHFIESSGTNYLFKAIGLKVQSKLFTKENNSSLDSAIKIANEMCCYNRTRVPIAYAFDGKQFLFENMTIYYHGQILQEKITFTQVYKFFSMALITGEIGNDEWMHQETDKIYYLMEGMFNKYRRIKSNRYFDIQMQKSITSSYELIEVFSKYQWVHYVGHGEIHDDAFHFVFDNNKKVNIKQLEQMGIRFPKVLVLSACYSVHSSVRKAFFNNGGRCLIGSVGRIPSEKLAALFVSFYWQILYKKYTVLQAFTSIQKKSLSDDGLACFYLQVHGNPNVGLLT